MAAQPRKTVTADGGKGIAVDAGGQPAYDPSQNVLALVEKSITRIDDRMADQSLLVDAKLQRVDDLARLRDERAELRAQYASELAKLNEKVEVLRAEHAKEIRLLESDRVDKVRQVDVQAGNIASDRALVAIQTLATVTASNAEAIRAQVATTATAQATQLDQRLAAVAVSIAAAVERVAAVEKVQNTAMGRSTVSDPASMQLAEDIRQLRAAVQSGAGKSQGVDNSRVWVLAILSGLATMFAIGAAIYGALKP